MLINLLRHTVSVCIISIIIDTPAIVYALLSCRSCTPKQIPYYRNFLREEIFVNLTILLSEEIFAIFEFNY